MHIHNLIRKKSILTNTNLQSEIISNNTTLIMDWKKLVPSVGIPGVNFDVAGKWKLDGVAEEKYIAFFEVSSSTCSTLCFSFIDQNL